MREILVFCSAKITFMETATSVKKDMWCFPGCAADVNCDWLHRQRRVDSMNVCLVRRSKHWQNKKHLLHPESANAIVSNSEWIFQPHGLPQKRREATLSSLASVWIHVTFQLRSVSRWVLLSIAFVAEQSAMLGSALGMSTFLVMWEGTNCQVRFI